MVAKLFTKPFGVAGDKTPIPNGVQVDGSVSYESGFGADYERQLGVDPAAKNIGRQTFNELMFDVTTSLQEMQAGFGGSAYSLALAQSLPGGGYPKGAVIPRLDGLGLWLNLTVNNTTNPDAGGAGWKSFNPQGGSLYAVDSGIENAYQVAFTPAITARSEDIFLCIKVKTTNTGPSTINDGVGTVPIVGGAQSALQGNELIANGLVWLQWNATLAYYVVVFSSAGAIQVPNAQKGLQAVNAGQIQQQNVSAFTATGTAIAQVLTPTPAIDAYVAGQRFNVTFSVASGVNPTINVSVKGPKNLKQYSPSGVKVAAVFAALQNTDIVYDGTDFILLNQLPSIAGQYRAMFYLSGPTTITTATHAGAIMIGLSNTAFNVQLPPVSSAPESSTFTFFNYFGGAMTLVCDGSDGIATSGRCATMTLTQGMSVTLVSNNGTSWFAVGVAQQATEAALGAAKIATQSQTNIGADDTTIVTPKKLQASLQGSALGNAQTWQDMSSSRVASTTYTNGTGRPIAISIYTTLITNWNASITVSGVVVATNTANNMTSGGVGTLTAIVPTGGSYSFSVSNAGIGKWMELR